MHIETNPGPISSNIKSLSVCHWNLNSITKDNFVKIPLLQAYLTTHKFDILRLSETYLDSTFLHDDPRLNLDGYSLLGVYYPFNISGVEFVRGGVCIFYKNYCYGQQQIIAQRHNLPNSASCIDLIFASQPNLNIDSGVHASLFPRCHQIIFY